MKPEQVWQAALGQLQLEVPKSAYDTWMRDTALLTHEDGEYVVGVNNACTPLPNTRAKSCVMSARTSCALR